MFISKTRLGLPLVVFAMLILGLLNTYTDTHPKASQEVEVDVCANAYRVVDGDTFDAFPVGRVRLADIDAPELGTPEGEIARQALSSLVDTYGPLVYLDVDDLYVMDRYNRVVAVVYLRYNSTHVINVNKWLADNGFASISDYRNEFDPYTWRPYVYLPYNPCIEKTMTTTITKLSTVTITSTTTQTLTTTTTVERIAEKIYTMLVITTHTLLLEKTIERTATVTIEKTETLPRTATVTLVITTPSLATTSATVERATTITKTYTETSTSISTVIATVTKENWVLIGLAGIIAVVLFAVGYSLGRRVNM